MEPATDSSSLVFFRKIFIIPLLCWNSGYFSDGASVRVDFFIGWVWRFIPLLDIFIILVLVLIERDKQICFSTNWSIRIDNLTCWNNRFLILLNTLSTIELVSVGRPNRKCGTIIPVQNGINREFRVASLYVVCFHSLLGRLVIWEGPESLRLNNNKYLIIIE